MFQVWDAREENMLQWEKNEHYILVAPSLNIHKDIMAEFQEDNLDFVLPESNATLGFACPRFEPFLHLKYSP